jgi:hypothetical protein
MRRLGGNGFTRFGQGWSEGVKPARMKGSESASLRAGAASQQVDGETGTIAVDGRSWILT